MFSRQLLQQEEYSLHGGRILHTTAGAVVRIRIDSVSSITQDHVRRLRWVMGRQNDLLTALLELQFHWMCEKGSPFSPMPSFHAWPFSIHKQTGKYYESDQNMLFTMVFATMASRGVNLRHVPDPQRAWDLWSGPQHFTGSFSSNHLRNNSTPQRRRHR